MSIAAAPTTTPILAITSPTPPSVVIAMFTIADWP